MSNHDGKTRYININGNSGVYWTTEEGNIFVRTSEPSQPTASEIAKALADEMEKRTKTDEQIKYAEDDCNFWNKRAVNFSNNGNTQLENGAIYMLMIAQRRLADLRRR
jgi:hypothetical protein